VTHDGPIENWLAIIGVVSLIYWGWRICAALLSRGRSQESAPTAPAPAAASVDVAAPPVTAPPESDIAVIAAAVYAVLGAHRIVHLEPEGQEHGWAVEGRWMQQTSHVIRP